MQKRKIFLIATALLVVITAVSAVLLQSGETFKGWSLIPSTTTDEPEIPYACGPNNVNGLIPADEPYVFGNITDEMCKCDASSNWIVNPSFVFEDVRLEDAQKPCICNYGYEEEFFQCVPVSQEDTEEQTVTLMTEDYERADLSDSDTEIVLNFDRPFSAVYTLPESEPDEPSCVFTSPEIDYCTPNGDCIDNSHLELNRCQCDEGYEFENFKCEPVEQEPEEQEPEEQEPEEQEPVSESEPAAETTEKVVSCGDLMDELSVTFYDKDWEAYDEAMRNLELKNCLQDNCDSKFYWAVLYISLRDTVKAKLYYNASECADCQWYTDLSGYASIDMSKFNFDDTLLKDLAQNTLKTCSPPENFDKFLENLKNAAKAFSSKYFGAEAKDTNRKLAFKSFPTAYAQSVEFSDDVESALEEEYNAIYGEETETETEAETEAEAESEPKPQCRSLNIVRPEYFQVTEGQKIIKIPVEGFSNQELAIVLDSDPGAVSLFRYKSMEGTITFDNRGTVLDTEKTSVYMDSVDTSKGDIVTVWAMDEKFTGLQECHDALYVEIDKSEPVAQVVQQEPVNRSESEVQTQVAAATAYAYDYNAPVTLHAGAPEVPKNGPEVVFYVIGAVAILSLKKSFQPK